MRLTLSPELLLQTYRAGIFPMADPDADEIHWFCPDPRAVIDLDRFCIARTLRQTIRQRRFDIRIDAAFDAVIHACADREDDTWISPAIIDVFCRLHHMGVAHSVEAWQGDRLAGGLYGVAIGGVFFGESMFHRITDAGKVALAALVDRMRARRYQLLDIQFLTPHLVRFGAREIPRATFLARLQHALTLNCTFTEPHPKP